MSGILNFLTLFGLIAAMHGFERVAQLEEQVFPVLRSEKFATFSIEMSRFADGSPCHPDALDNPILTAKQRAIDCQ